MEANTSYTDAGYDMYNDIKHRTNGEIYLGVVGPVRTGKSTFIRRFMELCVLPVMQDENEKQDKTPEMLPFSQQFCYTEKKAPKTGKEE